MQEVIYKGKVIKIYDLEDCKKSSILADIKANIDYKKDIEVQKHRKYPDEYFYSYPNAFDTETTTLLEHTKWNLSDEPIGFTYLYQFNLFGTVFMFRLETEVKEFFQLVQHIFETNKYRLVFYVHNLSYEWQFIKDWINVVPDTVFATEKRKIISFRTESNIEFRCSYRLTNMNLEKFTQDYSTFYVKEKEIMDYDLYRDPFTELDDSTLLYSALDVLALSDGLQGFMKANNFTIKDNRPTSTSIVRHSVRDVMLSKHNRQFTKDVIRRTALDTELYKIFLDLKAGGNTHANREHVGLKLKNLGHGDFTSSYPYQMVCNNTYPMFTFQPISFMKNGIFDFKLYKEISNTYVIISRFKILNPRLIKDKYVPIPYLSLSRCFKQSGACTDLGYDNGRITNFKGIIDVAFYDIEFINCFITQYDFDAIESYDTFISMKGFLPKSLRESVYNYYEKKTELKGVAGAEYEYMKSKNCVNGIFGMAYTDPVRDMIIFNPQTRLLEEQITETTIQQQLEEYYSKRTTFLAYQWGSYTAMLGRVALQSMIDIFDPHDVVYCDTDSCFFLHPEKYTEAIKEYNRKLLTDYQPSDKDYVKNYAVTKKGIEKYLGIIDMEDNADIFVTLGAKKYCQQIGDTFEITIAGVPKKTGSKIMGTPDNFRTGFLFGEETGKKRLVYNDCESVKRVTTPQGTFNIYSNVAMLKTTYQLDITDRFEKVVEYVQGKYVEDYETI